MLNLIFSIKKIRLLLVEYDFEIKNKKNLDLPHYYRIFMKNLQINVSSFLYMLQMHLSLSLLI
jgi:hypothetical protein